MKSILLLPVIALSFALNAQEDSLHSQELKEIIVDIPCVQLLQPLEWEFRLPLKQIEQVNATDVGELIGKLPGTNVRSYGGLGGLKTVSTRGLNPQDNGVVIDGFEQINSQNGTVNLSQIETDNVNTVVLHDFDGQSFMLPVGALIKGSSIGIYTKENLQSEHFTLAANLKYGSFDQKSAYLMVKNRFRKFYYSIYGKFREAEGDYPFTFRNGFEDVEMLRANNQYFDSYAGTTLRLKTLKGDFRLMYRMKYIDQQLPGAVILYNNTADETLRTIDNSIQMDFVNSGQSSILWRGYATYNHNDLTYSDPTFLNNAQGVNDRYENRSAAIGLNSLFFKFYRWSILAGIESRYSDLLSNSSLPDGIFRSHTQSVVRIQGIFNKISLKAQVGNQFLLDQHSSDEHNTYFTWNPLLTLRTPFIRNKRSHIDFYYKNSFRMPTFNELYYGQLNLDLEPERAHQFGVNSMVELANSRWKIYANYGLYYNRIQDKILAIPTQNQFVWSMQNIGKVDIFGGDVSLNIQKTIYKFKRILTLSIRPNYAYNASIDRTLKGSPTFGHQLAYCPEHTANLDVSLSNDIYNFGISFNYVGNRYALNENIPANVVDEFYTFDAFISRTFHVKEIHKLTIQVNAKNVLNHQYSYIRSYAMPGFNYLISLRYAIR